MPEVIDLLSSPLASPAQAPALAAAGAPKSPLDTLLSEDDDLDFLDLTQVVAPADLDGLLYSPPKLGRSNGTTAALTRTSPDKTRQLHGPAARSKPVGTKPAGLKRWNSALDPIQASSDPIDLTLDSDISNQHCDSRSHNTAPAGPARKVATECRSDISSDLFVRTSPAPPGPCPLPTMSTKGKGKATVSWDPISSSMPDPAPAPAPARSHDGNVDEDPFATSSPPRERVNKRRVKRVDVTHPDESSDDSEAGLPAIRDLDYSKVKPRSLDPHDHLAPAPARKRTKQSVPSTAEEREAERRRKAEAKADEVERKRREREQAKEQKALNKEREKALVEANKLRVDKRVAVAEMILDLPDSLAPDLRAQIETLFDELKVKRSTYHSPVDGVVRWRRNVSSRYNHDRGHWEPIVPHIKAEAHLLVAMKAAEFVDLVLAGEGADLEAHVLKMKVAFPANTIIYLIEGLTQWKRANAAIRNRQFASAVRNVGAADADADADVRAAAVAPSSSTQSRRRRKEQVHVDENLIEDGLLQLQVEHGALIQETSQRTETARWILLFTEQLGTAPYKQQAEASRASANFCIASGQVRTGSSGDGAAARDTFVRMLQQTQRVTPAIAHGIQARYATASDLLRGFEADGPLALADCHKSANRDGAFSDRTVGAAVSRRLYKIFTCRDPASTDI